MDNGFNPNLVYPESEQNVVGACLQYGEQALAELTVLRPEHFACSNFHTAFEAIQAMAANNDPINPITVYEWLIGHNKSTYCSLENLFDAAQNCPSWHVKKHESIIVGRYQARKAIDMAQNLIETLTARGGSNAPILIDGLSNALSELNQTSLDDDATYDAADLMKIALSEFQKRYDNGSQFTGLRTGIKSLDDKLFGLQKSNLYVLAGRPGMGKTAISMSIAEYVADTCQDQGAVLVFNLEMSKEQLAMRSLASTGEVSLSDIQHGNDSSGENYNKMNDACNVALKRKMFCDVRSNISIQQMRGKARKIKNKHGLSLIVVDYLGLIDDQGNAGNSDNARISWLSRQIKSMAKDLDVPIILLCQLSRKCEERPNKRPKLSDLRDSGSIEQDADAVIFSYRDGYYTNNQKDDMLELIVAKQRMGQCGTAYACFRGEYSKVLNVEEAYVVGMLNQRNPSRAEKHKGRLL